MSFKKKCIKIKQEAKKLGYDIKLTHVQEILARAEGYESRHAKLKEEVELFSHDVSPFGGTPGSGKSSQIKPLFFYYDVHVFYSMDDGYSTFVRSEKELMDFEAIDLAYQLGFIDEGDIRQVSYVDEIDEESYKNAIGGDSPLIECSKCRQFYQEKSFKKSKNICVSCLDKKRK